MSKSYHVSKAKSYTVAERVNYHSQRIQSDNATDNQRTYSRHWLEEFNDQHASGNLSASQRELKERQQYVKSCEKDIANQRREIQVVKSLNKTVFGGYISGAKANLNKK